MTGGILPPGALESLSATPTSQQMLDAAAELAFRIAHGEFDDLDEMQRSDLEALAQIIEVWAGRVAALEAGARVPQDDTTDDRAKP